MRLSIAALLAIVVTIASCSGGAGAVDPERREADVAEVMALSLVRLVTVDNTFGPDHRFSEVLVLQATDPEAGDGAGVVRPLSEQERLTIEAALSSAGSMRWIDDANEYRTTDLAPSIAGSAIVGVGEPRFDRRGALVPVSLWCGGLCGTWFTYRLVFEDGGWRVEGPEGPIAVS